MQIIVFPKMLNCYLTSEDSFFFFFLSLLKGSLDLHTQFDPVCWQHDGRCKFI